jgi:hypothetical protein
MNTLQRATSIISQDPTFSVGAQAAAKNILSESMDQAAGFEPRSTDSSSYVVSDSDERCLMSWWTSYSGLSSDSEDEPTTLDVYSTVPEGTLWTRRTTSAPPASRSRTAEGRHRYDELARRIVLSPHSEWGTTEEASSYPAEQLTDGLVTSARFEPCAAEEASSYLTEEFTEGLVTSVSSEP